MIILGTGPRPCRKIRGFDGDNRFVNRADKVEPTRYDVDQLAVFENGLGSIRQSMSAPL